MTGLLNELNVKTTTTATRTTRTGERDATAGAVPAKVREMLESLAGMFPRLQDRRLFPRHPYVARMSVAGPDGAVHELWTRDISPWNVGFVGDVRLETAVAVSLRLDLPGGGRWEGQGRVMRCREFTAGCYEGFVNFTSVNLPDDVLARITAAGESK